MDRESLNTSVDTILEGLASDSPNSAEASDPFASATARMRDLSDAEQAVQVAEAGLRQEVDVLLNQLALQIRRADPRLTVEHGRGGYISIKYGRTAGIVRIRPNIENRKFEVLDSPFERRFKRYHGHTLSLGPEVVSSAVVEFFKQNYRSLQ